jgi:predicted HTH transcriptional regulator
MFDTNKELLEKIKMGEDSTIEFKEVSVQGRQVRSLSRDSIADEMAAFANSRSGVMVFGVDDKEHVVVGLELHELDIVETWLRSICNDSIEPQLYCDIQKIALETLDGLKYVIKVDIPKSLFVHRSPGGYFTKIGSSKRQMKTDMLARLLQQRSQARLVTFDEFPLVGVTSDILIKEKWETFKTELSPKDETEFLVKLRLLAFDEDGSLCPTVAGVLMTAGDPQQYMRNAYIQAVAYRTTQRDAIQQYDARDITGTLDQQIYEACQFVARNMRIGATKNMGRIDVPQYEMSAIFEAITNAVAHRDYAIHGSAIRLHMFSDRLEIYSPGAIPNTMSVETLPLRQFSRNPLLTSLLARCSAPRDFSGVGQWLDRTHIIGTEYGSYNQLTAQDQRLLSKTAMQFPIRYIMDRRGEGVPIILRKSQELSGKMPLYEVIGEDELKLTIYAADPQQLSF